MKLLGRIQLLLVATWLVPCVQSLFGSLRRTPDTRLHRATLQRSVSLLRAGSDQGDEDELLDPIIVFRGSEDGEEVPQRAIILMDSFCPYHGMFLVSRAQEFSGTAVIPVLSNYLYDFLMATEPENADEYKRMRLPTDLAAWRQRLPPMELVGVYCESDSGLPDAERLRKDLSVVCRDDPDELEARRNKFLMQEKIRKDTDAPALRQKLCTRLSEAQEYASSLFDEGHKYVVVKPYRGVASEAVQLCQNSDEVARAFDAILGSAIFGSRDRHESVLLQEFLQGQEYAIDVVSRNGRHKVAAVWRYDKRPANGASFCYYQTRLIDADMDPCFHKVCDYISKTLTALGIRYGISHNEVIVTSDRGPMLVEVNCRQHNMDFIPVTMACIGYNAFDMLLISMLADEKDWEQFPDLPVLHGHGCMVHLVNSAEGRLKGVNFLEEMSRLGSFVDGEVYEYFLAPGSPIKPTIDIRSDAGWVQLINEDEEALVRDYNQIVEWMPNMFEVEES